MSTDTDKAWAAIKSHIAKPPKGSIVVTVTPELAGRMLGLRGEGNRKPKHKKQQAYIKDMAAGEWAITGDTLKISDAGELRDGQNRLEACVKSGAAFTTHMVFGVPDAYFDRMDIGKPRSISDIMGAHGGMKNATNVGAAARWVRLIDSDRVKLRESYDPRTLSKMVMEDYGGMEGIGSSTLLSTGRAIYKVTNRAVPLSVATALAYILNRECPEHAPRYLNAWGSRDWSSSEFKVLRLLDDALAKTKTLPSNHRDTTRAAQCVIAWNAYVKRSRVEHAMFDWIHTRDDFPKVAS